MTCIASSTVSSVYMISSSGTISKYPDEGRGVVGTYTAEDGLLSMIPRSAVRSPKTLVPGLGKSIRTTEW